MGYRIFVAPYSQLMKHDNTDSTDLIFDGSKAFAFYRKPNSPYYELMYTSQEALVVTDSPADFIDRLGFLIMPFSHKEAVPGYFIPAETYLKEPAVEDLLLQTGNLELQASSGIFSASKADYAEQFQQMMQAFEGGKLKKAILSRIMLEEKQTDFHPGKALLALGKRYPKATVYLTHIPGQGTWMGATPETLLHGFQHSGNTVSLAGTQQKTSQEANDAHWGDKEIEEQALVTDFVRETLQNHPGLEIHQEQTTTADAGNLWHICTSFQFRWQKNNKTAASLIGKLHPTPAVSGFPVETAIDLINRTEKHARAYYAGYLGPTGIMGTFFFYVNLRCMQVFKEHLALYVGGGLTAQSELDKEWDETVNKANTLLSVIQNL